MVLDKTDKHRNVRDTNTATIKGHQQYIKTGESQSHMYIKAVVQMTPTPYPHPR